MSYFDERKILRRLNDISQIKPADEVTLPALDKVRQQMTAGSSLDAESDGAAEHGIFTVKRAVLAIAAVVVVALVVIAGQMFKSVDQEK